MPLTFDQEISMQDKKHLDKVQFENLKHSHKMKQLEMELEIAKAYGDYPLKSEGK